MRVANDYKMKWTEHKKPNEHTSRYDHIMCDTPLGIYIIEWKSWKEQPSYSLILNENHWICSEDTLEEAKHSALKHLKDKFNEIKNFLGE